MSLGKCVLSGCLAWTLVAAAGVRPAAAYRIDVLSVTNEPTSFTATLATWDDGNPLIASFGITGCDAWGPTCPFHLTMSVEPVATPEGGTFSFRGTLRHWDGAGQQQFSGLGFEPSSEFEILSDPFWNTFGWSLDAGGTFEISATVLPEPAGLAALVVGLGAWVGRRAAPGERPRAARVAGGLPETG